MYPGPYIKLIPTQNNLSDSEVALCHDLLGLQGSFKSPETKPEARKQEPSSGETSKQSSGEEEEEEEYDDYLYEYIAIKAKGGFDSMQDEKEEEDDDDDISEVVTSGDSADSNQAGESGDAIDLLCGKVFNSMKQKPKVLKPKSKPYTVPTWAKAKKLPTSKGRGTSSESKRLAETKKPRGLLSDAQAQYQYAHGNGKWPMSDILEPGLNDVLVGRGGKYGLLLRCSFFPMCLDKCLMFHIFIS